MKYRKVQAQTNRVKSSKKITKFAYPTLRCSLHCLFKFNKLLYNNILCKIGLNKHFKKGLLKTIFKHC